MTKDELLQLHYMFMVPADCVRDFVNQYPQHKEVIEEALKDMNKVMDVLCEEIDRLKE